MRQYLCPHYLLVFGGLALGLAVGIFIIDFEPAIVGWIVGGGVGLSGGAYIAALSSGDPLAGGGTEHLSNSTLDELYGSENPPVPAPPSTRDDNDHRPS